MESKQKDTPATLAALKNHYEGKLNRAYKEVISCNTALSDLYDRANRVGFKLSEKYVEEQE